MGEFVSATHRVDTCKHSRIDTAPATRRLPQTNENTGREKRPAGGNELRSTASQELNVNLSIQLQEGKLKSKGMNNISCNAFVTVL